MGKSTISMVMFNSYVTNYQRVKVDETMSHGQFHPVKKSSKPDEKPRDDS